MTGDARIMGEAQAESAGAIQDEKCYVRLDGAPSPAKTRALAQLLGTEPVMMAEGGNPVFHVTVEAFRAFWDRCVAGTSMSTELAASEFRILVIPADESRVVALHGDWLALGHAVTRKLKRNRGGRSFAGRLPDGSTIEVWSGLEPEACAPETAA